MSKTKRTRIAIFEGVATSLGIHVSRIKNTPLFKLTYKGKEVYMTRGTMGNSAISTIAHDVCENKSLCKNLFVNHGVKTPKWREFDKETKICDIEKYCKQLRYPVIVKPYDGVQGRDIEYGIENITQAIKAVRKVRRRTGKVIVEEIFKGDEIRVLVTREKLLAAAWRRPASVVGDGVHNIRQLVKIKNKKRHFNLKPIKVNKKVVKEQGLDMTNIPEIKKRIYLQRCTNISLGGDSIDVTDEVHPSLIKIALKAINALPEVKYTGLDIMTKNYKKRQWKRSYTVIEANAFPGFFLHCFPYKGKRRDTVTEILKIMFPNLKIKKKS